MDVKYPSRDSNKRMRFAAVAATIALTTCWSSGAYSRTQSDVDCAEVARNLQSLEIPVKSLSLETVDHVPMTTEAAAFDAGEPDITAADSAAPLLDLTPRAESALRDIFDDSRQAWEADTAVELSSSPIAETEDIPDISELPKKAVQESQIDEDSDLPLLQRQMYRTDI